MFPSDVLTLANIVLFISNLPNIYSIIKCRRVVRGYSISGTSITLVGLTLLEIWYVMMGPAYLLPVLISFTTMIYYILVWIFTFKLFLKNRNRV